MKSKTLLSCFIVLTSFNIAQAQISKGSLWLGGGISVYDSRVEDNTTIAKQSSIYFTPVLGKAVRENLIAGILLNLGHNNNTVTDVTDVTRQKSKTYGAGVFIRKYLPLIKNVYVFGTASARFDFQKTTGVSQPAISSSIKSWFVTLNATPGLSFKLNNKLHLETGLNSFIYLQYRHEKSLSKNSAATISKSQIKTFSAGASLENLSDLYIGFRFLLSKS